MQDAIIISHGNIHKVVIIIVLGKYGITFLSPITSRKQVTRNQRFCVLKVCHFINLTLFLQMLKMIQLLCEIILFFRIITFAQNYN